MIFFVLTWWIINEFEKAYSKRPGSDNELNWRRVNEMRNCIETDAVTNETASV